MISFDNELDFSSRCEFNICLRALLETCLQACSLLSPRHGEAGRSRVSSSHSENTEQVFPKRPCAYGGRLVHGTPSLRRPGSRAEGRNPSAPGAGQARMSGAAGSANTQFCSSDLSTEAKNPRFRANVLTFGVRPPQREPKADTSCQRLPRPPASPEVVAHGAELSTRFPVVLPTHPRVKKAFPDPCWGQDACSVPTPAPHPSSWK